MKHINTSEDDLRWIGDLPELRRPVLVAGFGGWGDAGEIATYSLRSLVSAWSATRFAEIEPETFFDFTETRPIVHIGPTGQRDVQWPTNAFYAHRITGAKRDVILLVGNEPQLRWKTFCRLILEVAEVLDVSCLVTLGGLLADVPHTREPMLTGFASTARLLPQLQQLGVKMSSYEGPTGIVGVLNDAWRSTRRPAISLWGSVPHYISATPNPQVSLALLRRVSTILGARLPLTSLERHVRTFDQQVAEALQDNPEALEYVRQLELEHADDESPVESPGLIQALEEFLRSSRPAEDPE